MDVVPDRQRRRPRSSSHPLRIMPSPEPARVVEALARVVREALTRGEAVHVPGLGTFRIHREDSTACENDRGEMVMAPPRDVVLFEADA